MDDNKVIDAEFVDIAGDEKKDAKPRYGRRTVARAKTRVDHVADLLEASQPFADAAAKIARAAGADEVAERAERAAELTTRAAEVVREVPVAVAAVERETRGLRTAWGKLVKSAKEAGVVGERRAPRTAVRNVRKHKKSEGAL